MSALLGAVSFIWLRYTLFSCRLLKLQAPKLVQTNADSREKYYERKKLICEVSLAPSFVFWYGFTFLSRLFSLQCFVFRQQKTTSRYA